MATGSTDLSPADHLRLAREFLDFGARLAAADAPDETSLGWAVTAAYYASLHAVSGYFLARHGERPGSHVERERLLHDRRYPEFGKQDREDYFGLKNASERSRYLGVPTTVLHHTLYRQRAERLVAKWGDRAGKAAS
jgi:hypothetical protein